MNKNVFLSALATAGAVALLVACSIPSQTTSDVPMKAASFEYTPGPVAGNKANFSISVFTPNYDKSFSYGGQSPFNTFQKSLGGDVEELLVAKGFTLRGPYKNLDDMVFNDKKQTEMVLDVTIDPQLNTSGGKWVEAFAVCGQGARGYRFKGPVVVTWKINLTGTEPQSGEKLWRKSVELDPMTVETEGVKGVCSRDISSLFQDAGVMNPLIDALQAQYKSVLDKLAKHIEAEEFNSLKTQIQEIKSKKGY